MTRFRPCIDIHKGQVKQIVGSSLSSDPNSLKTNFISPHPAFYFANLYKEHNLQGAHVIMLGEGCEEAAKKSLLTFPDMMQIGGGININNCTYWIDECRASHIIVTSWLFPDSKFDINRLRQLSEKVEKKKLVVDLSCKQGEPENINQNSWIVALNKWQTLSDSKITSEFIDLVSEYCSELLIHSADVEGKCKGINKELVSFLGESCDIPCTYAGGSNSITDLDLVNTLSNGKVDITFGSSLDIFGGSNVKFTELVAWNQRNII